MSFTDDQIEAKEKAETDNQIKALLEQPLFRAVVDKLVDETADKAGKPREELRNSPEIVLIVAREATEALQRKLELRGGNL